MLTRASNERVKLLRIICKLSSHLADVHLMRTSTPQSNEFHPNMLPRTLDCQISPCLVLVADVDESSSSSTNVAPAGQASKVHSFFKLALRICLKPRRSWPTRDDLKLGLDRNSSSSIEVHELDP